MLATEHTEHLLFSVEDEVILPSRPSFNWSEFLSLIKAKLVDRLDISIQLDLHDSLVLRNFYGESTYIEFENLSLDNRRLISEFYDPVMDRLSLPKDVFTKSNVIKITYHNQGDIEIGYAFLNASLPTFYHRRVFSFSFNDRSATFRLFDIETLVGEMILLNHLLHFSCEQYLFLLEKSTRTSLLSEGESAIFVSFLNNFHELTFFHLNFEPYRSFVFSCMQSYYRKLWAVQKSQILSSKKSVARSYETKKRIPTSTQYRMSYSPLLSHYGFVEYDSSLTHHQINLIEKGFSSLLQELSIPVDKETSIRFRRIGQHRLEGMYFYTKKCLVIGLSCLDTYVHELGHQIDYIASTDGFNNRLSQRKEFVDLYHCYLDYLSKDQKRYHEASLKYGEAYILSYREVFARCFEWFCSMNGIKNPLLRSSFDPLIYPTDHSLDSIVEDYFRLIVSPFLLSLS